MNPILAVLCPWCPYHSLLEKLRLSTETETSSRWQKKSHWLHQRLSWWHPPVQLAVFLIIFNAKVICSAVTIPYFPHLWWGLLLLEGSVINFSVEKLVDFIRSTCSIIWIPFMLSGVICQVWAWYSIGDRWLDNSENFENNGTEKTSLHEVISTLESTQCWKLSVPAATAVSSEIVEEFPF